MRNKYTDMNAINTILANCNQKEYLDCKDYLLNQSYVMIERIYDLMFNKDGEENDFIPTGCSLKTLEVICLKLINPSIEFDKINSIISTIQDLKLTQINIKYKSGETKTFFTAKTIDRMKFIGCV